MTHSYNHNAASIAPPGWQHNPSIWPQRVSLIVIAFVGFYLSQFVNKVWDSIFGDNTMNALTLKLYQPEVAAHTILSQQHITIDHFQCYGKKENQRLHSH